MKVKLTFLLLVISFLNFAGVGFSQLIEVPLPTRPYGQNLRIKADSIPIDLPIWDDFSSSTGSPDTTYWVAGNTIFVNPGIGLNPPSLNVATFDGWDANGNPYNLDSNAKGKTDSLVSRPINLGAIPASLQTTIFLSFYYQKHGNGDIPNNSEGDSLILQFKRSDDSWETVWPLPGETVSTVSNFFTQKILQVQPEFLYNGFQFKFQAHGRQSGPFDTWNIDYVYLDKRRNINDVNYLDRTFTTVPTSLFQPYSAIPIDHFFQDPDPFLQSPAVDFLNLERQVQPVEYSAIVRDKLTSLPLDTLILDSAFLALRFPLGQFRLNAGTLDPLQLDNAADSLIMETTFYMDSGDNFLIDSISSDGLDTTRYQTVDLRINDTTSVVSVLSDYYAYDDGTAEFGAGINQLNGRLAYMFVTNTPDFVTSIDINFINIGRNVGGTPIELFVLDSLVDNTTIENKTNATAQVINDLNGFVSYSLSEPVFVTDTFYIGYQQTTSDFLPVGLDKNTEVNGRIFLNVTGTWEQDVLTKGSLMMRPRLGESLITGIESEEIDKHLLYPNPTKGKFTIRSNPKNIEIYNLDGRRISYDRIGKEVDISAHPSSVYLVRFQLNGKWYSHRLVLR